MRPMSFCLACPPARLAALASGVGLAVTLSACGGGADLGADSAGTAPQVSLLSAVAEPAMVEAQPLFHRLPMAVAEPSDTDTDGHGMSAYQTPAIARTPIELSGLSTRGLTDEGRERYRSGQLARAPSSGSGSKGTPAATSTTSVVYTPAQIRSAYNLPATSLASASNLGAGQTIYIIDAYHHPNAVRDLNSFSTQFGLPKCTQVAVSPGSTSLPAAPASSCTIAVLYSTSSGGMTTVAPAYNLGWAQEIALDVQWAHAIAPLARIVLIEAASASLANLNGSIMLANRLGAGAVSMSFSAQESSWVNLASYSTALFSTKGMSYFAATGDAGTQVNWPAVVPSVVGVGGTSLNYTPTLRSEKAWSGTGGGISAFVSMPSYQTGVKIAGEPTAGAKYRSAGDVAMTADPYTGVYVAFSTLGATQPRWYAFGGTSLATPMWAATVTVANANRAIYGYPTLSSPHAKLYGALALASSYASNFHDITAGANGTCSSCYAISSYDSPTGLGSPFGANLLAYLGNSL